MGIHCPELFPFFTSPLGCLLPGNDVAIFASPITSHSAGTGEDGGEAMSRVSNVCPLHVPVPS